VLSLAPCPVLDLVPFPSLAHVHSKWAKVIVDAMAAGRSIVAVVAREIFFAAVKEIYVAVEEEIVVDDVVEAVRAISDEEGGVKAIVGGIVVEMVIFGAKVKVKEIFVEVAKARVIGVVVVKEMVNVVSMGLDQVPASSREILI
jgi:hypothetical protein